MESTLTYLEGQNAELLPGRLALGGFGGGLGGFGGGFGGFGGFGFTDIGVGTVVANNHAVALFGSVATAAQVISQNVN